MGIGRSTFYDTPDANARDLTIVAEMKTICDEFEAYGYRRVKRPMRPSRSIGLDFILAATLGEPGHDVT